MRNRALLVGLTASALLLGSCSGSSGTTEPAATTTEATSTSTSTSTTALAMDPRAQLTRRFASEFDDEGSATRVVAAMTDDDVTRAQALADDDIAESPWLSYRPSTVPADQVDSLWVFSYGYRLAPGAPVSAVPVGGEVPPMECLLPGPTNEELAQQAADFVQEHPVPIVAQWEVAEILEQMGVTDVISVDPDVAADGTVTYLSTSGVADKGLLLMGERGVAPGHAGVLCFSDHAVRCLLTARAAGLTADVPDGVSLPSTYDPESGQEWTRSRESWVPVDLLGRTLLKAQG